MEDPAGIHLAMKTVGTGTAKVQVYDAKDGAKTNVIKGDGIETATDLYYDITDLNGTTVVISNPADSTVILSITNIKVTHPTTHVDKDFANSGYFTIDKISAKQAVKSLMTMHPNGEPEETVPEETVPETTVPEETVPETTVPEETVPETTVPEETVPETTVPEETVPETTVPEPTEPEVFEPNRFDVRLSDSSVRAGSKVIVTATTGKDVEYITVNGRKVTTYSGSQFSNTRVWQISVDAKDVGRLNVSVVCYNRDKLASQALVRTVTVTRQYVDVSGIVKNLTTSMVKDLIAGIVDYLRIGR